MFINIITKKKEKTVDIFGKRNEINYFCIRLAREVSLKLTR